MPYRFSGHETFPCRYTWLPKAYLAVLSNPVVFADEEQAMVALGVGKNMVRAIRFWMQAANIVEPRLGTGYQPTSFGTAVFREDGLDAFLEDRQTLWLIHWFISTIVEEPLFAWEYMLNRWPHPEISRAAVKRAFEQESQALGKKLSGITLEQHFDVFLHTYVPTRSRKGNVQEDNLDCPLVELELIQKIGERELGEGRREPLYAFRREEKRDISGSLFVYCLANFWQRRRPSEGTLSVRDVAVGVGSPGQIFKLPEWDIRERLESIERDSRGEFYYQESAAEPQIRKNEILNFTDEDRLANIYLREPTHA